MDSGRGGRDGGGGGRGGRGGGRGGSGGGMRCVKFFLLIDLKLAGELHIDYSMCEEKIWGNVPWVLGFCWIFNLLQ